MVPLLLALVASVAPVAVQELETATGAPFSLEETLASAPAILVFWNSWLPGGDEFVAVLDEVQRAASARGWPGAIIVFQDDGVEWQKELGTTSTVFPRVLDRRGTLLRRFQVTRAPAVVIVDRSGRVTERSGPSPAQVRAILRQLDEPKNTPR